MKKIVINTTFNNQKDRQKILQDISKLEGIKDVSFDLEKGTLTIIGDVDPVCIVLRLKKCGRKVDIATVGPPPKQEEKKPPEKKPPEKKQDTKPDPCVPVCIPPCLPPPCPPYPPPYCCEYYSNPCTIM